MVCVWVEAPHPLLLSYGCKWKHQKISLVSIFSATWSASDRPVSPSYSGTEAWIEVPQAPEGRVKKRLKHDTNNSIRVKML